MAIAFHLPRELEIHDGDERTFGPCDCCGNLTRRVWGYVNEREAAIAAYFVEWTPGHPEQAANFDLIVGRWGDDAVPTERSAVAVAFRLHDLRPQFMVVNAADRPVSASPLVGHVLSREEVIGSELATEVFEICDLILLRDPRISILRGEGT